MSAGKKIIWSRKMISFLKNNYLSMNNWQLADALGLGITAVRTKLYEMGYKRVEYWTEEQVAFLLNNYKQMGDVEIAELFNVICPKNKLWRKKHIEKKRKYLKINRTKKQLCYIKKRNRELGCFSFNHWRRWDKRKAPVGTVKIWGTKGKKYKVIKTKAGYIHYAPWLYKKEIGPIPEGRILAFKDRDNLNVIPENLELIDRAEHARRNNVHSVIGLSDNYIAGILSHKDPELRQMLKANPDLLEVKRKQLQLNRTIYAIEQSAGDTAAHERENMAVCKPDTLRKRRKAGQC